MAFWNNWRLHWLENLNEKKLKGNLNHRWNQNIFSKNKNTNNFVDWPRVAMDFLWKMSYNTILYNLNLWMNLTSKRETKAWMTFHLQGVLTGANELCVHIFLNALQNHRMSFVVFLMATSKSALANYKNRKWA